jgi:small redox-active disulfide protein 2
MLAIKILGGGCENCKRLEALTHEVVDALGWQAEFIHVTDHDEIKKYPILATPGLVVNEQLVSAGRIPSKPEIESLLKKAVG